MDDDPEVAESEQAISMQEDRYDLWGAFGRTHLSTPAERGVYLSLVGAPSDSRISAEDIATERGLELDEVDGVLARFESAGIAQGIDLVGAPRRYRWRDDMRYLEAGDPGSFDVVDPICLMPVRADTPYRTRGAEGEDRLFCSSLCLATFRAFPSTFSSSPRRSRSIR
jgi:YHS domain-containing protein